MMMKVEIKLPDRVLYEACRSWIEQQGQQAIPYAALPPQGAVVFIDGDPICCGWLYVTDGTCGVAFLHNVATNPVASPVSKAIAIKHGFYFMRQLGLLNRCTIILGSISNNKLLKLAHRLGWKADSNQTTNVSLSI
ncbi:MAG: hypothetical protein RR607_06170 [Akkermansia sp.]